MIGKNMNIIEYYKNQFEVDIHIAMDKMPYSQEKLSITNFGNKSQNKIFKRFEYKEDFLLCYFYTTLLDQSAYNSLDDYSGFQRLTNYPKCVGLFHSSNTNMPPELLLSLSIFWSDDLKLLETKIHEFTEYFFNDVECFIQERLLCSADEYFKLIGVIKGYLYNLSNNLDNDNWCLKEPISSGSYELYKETVLYLVEFLEGLNPSSLDSL